MGTSYKDAGVDIEAGDALVERIRRFAGRTHRPEMIAGIGGFAALTRIDLARFPRPVLVSGTDGVGTKVKVAQMMGVHDTVGIDLVAMCANDVLTVGAEPLLFLDYFATGRLDVDVAEAVVSGVAEGCVQAGAALAGGETAEMPSMYAPGEYDLAGFLVGVLNEGEAIDGARAVDGDVIVGLASTGLHSNGYSLARKICFELAGLGPADRPEGLDRSVGELLLAPTRIYVRTILPLVRSGSVRAMAHITGGGLPGNYLRTLPDGAGARVDRRAWTRPPIFDFLQRAGEVATEEMYQTFNMGIGFTVTVSPDDAPRVLADLAAAGERAWEIGRVTATGRFEWVDE